MRRFYKKDVSELIKILREDGVSIIAEKPQSTERVSFKRRRVASADMK